MRYEGFSIVSGQPSSLLHMHSIGCMPSFIQSRHPFIVTLFSLMVVDQVSD